MLHAEPTLDPDDHRAIAARLDLLHFQDEAPGMVFWHPRGLTLYRLLEDAARRHVAAAGYQEVRTPQILRRAIWEQSGHWTHHAHGMFVVGDDGAEAAVKPVSCPGHIQLVRHAAPSFRDLPMRLAEMGLCHRDEASGALHGLMRLRQFTQDDGHVFCAEAQIDDELERFCRGLPAFYAGFGFDDVSIGLSTRPPERAGDDASWDRAEAALYRVVDRLGLAWREQPGEGAFYGPKLELLLRDRRGRAWQLGTIQVDLVLPHRFDVRYVDAGGARRHVAILHRALYGSIERFLGIVLEHHAGALPAWLAPEQVAVLPVAAAQADGARAIAARFAAAGLRVKVDADDATLGKRIATAHRLGFPRVAVVGARELEDGTVAVRARDGRVVQPVAEAIAAAVTACVAP